jgi:RES domain
MTVLYPRERVKEVLRPLSLATAHRIVLKPCLSDPLTVRSSKSRFCDGRTYAVLYAAGDFPTAFAEVVVRDRLVQPADRRRSTAVTGLVETITESRLFSGPESRRRC